MILSIITINRNNLDGLRRTSESISIQSNQEFEWIVVDGASTDGSAEYIKSVCRSNIITISEPDTGIYNAMNKGTRLAHGEYCLYLNSGDVLHDDGVVDFLLKTCGTRKYDVLRGTMQCVWRDTGKKIISPSPKEITIVFLFSGFISHCATLIRRSLLLKYPYDEHFKIVSDHHFFRQIYLFENKLQDIRMNPKVVIADFDMSGISNTQYDTCSREGLESGKMLLGERLNHEFLDFIYGKGFFDSILCSMRRCDFWRITMYVWLLPLIVLFKSINIALHLPFIVKHLLR